MGRHKKIKSCDPFYNGPRRNSARKGDLAPVSVEQAAPKSLIRLLKYSEQVKTRKKHSLLKGLQTSSRNAAVANTNNTKKSVDGTKESHEPKLVASSAVSSANEAGGGGGQIAAPSAQGRSAMFVRRPGETTRSYLERIDIESKIRIVESLRKEKKKSNKRKKYLEERKKKFKSRKRKGEPFAKEFSDFKDEVKFGEVVRAPPKLSAKPRGSEKKVRQSHKSELLETTSPIDTKSLAAVVGLKHQRDVEEERVRVVSEYRMAKQLRLTKAREAQNIHTTSRQKRNVASKAAAVELTTNQIRK